MADFNFIDRIYPPYKIFLYFFHNPFIIVFIEEECLDIHLMQIAYWESFKNNLYTK